MMGTEGAVWKMEQTQEILAIVYFLVLAVINFALYAKLTKYLYICAGVTKEDVKKFTQNNVTNPQRRLVHWMRYRTEHPREFERMLAICHLCVGLSFLSIAFIPLTLIGVNQTILLAVAAALPILTAVAALIGFSYGKKAEQEFDGYFTSGRYLSYEEQMASDGPYYKDASEESRRNYERYGRSYNKNGEIDNHYRRVHYIFRVISILVVLILLVCAVIFGRPDGETPDPDPNEPQSIEASQPQNISPLSLENMARILRDEGFIAYEGINEAKMLYPDFAFNGCMIVDEDGMYFRYYSLETPEDAAGFQQTARAEIEETYQTGGADEKEEEESKTDFERYSLETGSGYATAIRAGNYVIYAHCDALNATWLKNLLYTYGFLEDF